jgi:hypothetical protein
MANILVNVVTKFDAKALLKGQKQLSTFDKSLNKLGKKALGLFAAQKIAAFGKASVIAFAADEKAAKSLAIQLKNTGNAFATPGVEAYIKYLEKATGVLDDQLRPSFQNILTVTGSVQKSQEGLNTALNVAAGTGKSVEEVSLAIAKAYGGQTKGLQSLGVGLDKANLKSGDMVKLLAELDTKFKGQALGRSGYTRQVDDFNVALENTKEIIGKGLLDSFAAIGGPNGMQGFTDGLLMIAGALAKVFEGTGKAIGAIGKFANMVGSGASWQVTFGTKKTAAQQFPGGDRAKEAAILAKKPLGDRAIDAKILAQKKSELDLLNKKNIATALASKDEAALAELKKKMDVERAGLMAALASATDEETKARILAKLQILDDTKVGASATLAKLNSELAAAKATDALRTAMDKAATATALAADSMTALKSINYGNYLGIPGGGTEGNTSDPTVPPIPKTNTETMPQKTVSSDVSNAGIDYLGVGALGNVTINLQSLDPSNAFQVVQNAVQELNRYGMNLSYAGSLGIVG